MLLACLASGGEGRSVCLPAHSSEDAALLHEDLLLRGAGVAPDLLDGLDNAVPLGDLPEDHVLAVQMRGLRRAEEELRAIGVGAAVCHGKDALAGVLQAEVLVAELGAVDALAAGAVTAREVAALNHEVGDDAMELAALVVQGHPARTGPLVACTEVRKVCNRLRDGVPEEPDGDALGLLLPDLHVEEDLVRDLRLFRCSEAPQEEKGQCCEAHGV
mmetsp:Transcript_66570/g.177303  ORF Transcript_66570/g.177303 Transcript_66570/m.177303 type:complete len:216 (+) Transcript_66570:3-650(+)